MKLCSAKRWFRNVTRISLASLLSLGLSGCILKLTGGFVFTDDIGTKVDLAFADVSAASCLEDDVFDPDAEGTTVECFYHIESPDGRVSSTSTAQLLSEFGLFGLLVDPVVVQVPEDAVLDVATVDIGAGPLDLLVSETGSFPVQPGVESTAEAGHKFWIVELPDAVVATLPAPPAMSGPMNFDFSFSLPGQGNLPDVPLKAMYTGRIDVGGESYFIPLFPCVSDFSQVPELRIPTGFDLFGLIFGIMDLYRNNAGLVCDNEVYDFTAVVADPVACDADGDSDVDRDDIRFIFANRNTPASGPDDPLDQDGDGMLTVLDARQCTLLCTRPGCAVD